MAKLFPYMHRRNFLSEELSEQILAYAVSREKDFSRSRVLNQGVLTVSDLRISFTLKDLGPYKEIFTENISKIIPEMIASLQISPFNIGEIEVQFAAHGNGAFFTSHIDTAVHEKTETPRIISAVYYLHSIPKKFQGGNLRLHTVPIGEENDQPKEITPDNNSLLVFPSHAPHEVLSVVAPNVEFKDWRFAVNCWIHRA